MNTPWLSVVMPSRNGQRWLPATLQSLKDQNDPGLELIVVDGSDDPDSVLEMLAAFSGTLNVRHYRRPDLDTWTAKTNFAVEQASASHICMLHTDDLWLPGRALRLRDWIARAPEAVMQLHPAYIVGESGKRLGIWRCPLPDDGSVVPAPILFERLLVQNFIAIPTHVIRRDAFLMVGGMDNRLWYTADWDLYLKLATIGPVRYHPDALACFRVHKHSLTVSGSRSLDDFREQMEIVLARFAATLPPQSADAVLAAAKASIAMNTALAAANAGEPAALALAALRVMALGPSGMIRYLRDSRILERSWPRLRARFAGAF